MRHIARRCYSTASTRLNKPVPRRFLQARRITVSQPSSINIQSHQTTHHQIRSATTSSNTSMSTRTTTTPNPSPSPFKAPPFHATLPQPNGTPQEVAIQPTPKANQAKLTEELRVLLAPFPSTPAIWTLDPVGDALHCSIIIPNRPQAESISARIMTVADEMKHHPHISIDDLASGPSCQMLFTCTTHRPRGLGVRDAKLAESIGRILVEELNDELASVDQELAAEQLRRHRDEISCGICT